MDPNACLERIIDAELDGDSDAFFDAARDLANWLKKGGSRPDWKRWDLRGLPKTTTLVHHFREIYGDA